MQESAYYISTAQDAGLMKNLINTLNRLSKKKEIEEYRITSDKTGSNRRVYFDFLYDDKVIQVSFLIANNSENISGRDVVNKNLLLLSLDLTEEDIKIFINDLKQQRIKGYEIEKKALKILLESRRENFKIEDVRYTTPYQDMVLKVDLVLRVAHYTFDPFNQKEIINVPIQLKASSRGQQLHKDQHPEIPSIVFYDNITPEQFVALIEKIIKNYIRFFHKKNQDPLAKPEGFHI